MPIKKIKPKEEAKTESQEITVTPQINPLSKKPFSKEQIALITRTVAKGATPDELALYLIVANKTGLDPFSRQIHFVKRKTKNGEVGVIQTGIDGYRAIAERSGGYAGSDEAIYDTEDAKNPNKATVTVYKIIQGVRCPFTASARWTEYCPPAPMDFMWRKMPYLMLSKTAEALALRKAFPNDLSGIYIDTEMDSTGKVVDASEVTAGKPQSVIVSPDPAVLTEVPIETVIKPTGLQNLFADARKFGAKEGEEAIFIQEQLNKDISWEDMTDQHLALVRTELMSKLTNRG